MPEEAKRPVKNKPIFSTPADSSSGHETATEQQVARMGNSTNFPIIPGYEITQEIGRGGMGVIYQATQIKLKRTVALKMMLASGSDRRFSAEAEAIAALSHPHIVQIFDMGEYQGNPYFALEYVPGGSLEQYLEQKGRMKPLTAARMLEKIARGVQAAHDCKVIHRDLKPHNILLDAKGEPKITDFGIAKLGNNENLTRTGAVIGTLHYMPPEQAEGKSKYVGPTADTYALGAILYKCLTGVVPFDADDFRALMWQIFSQEPKPPRELVSEVPTELEAICLKCLRKEPENRYQKAEDLANALQKFLDGKTVPTPSLPDWLPYVEEPAKTEPVKPTSNSKEVAIVPVPQIVSSTAVIPEVSARPIVRQRRTRIWLVLPLLIALLGGVGYIWYFSSSSNTAWESNILPYLQILNGHNQGVQYVDVSRDGKWILSSSDDKTIKKWDIQTTQELFTLTGHTNTVHAVCFSPNGKYILSASKDKTLVLRDAIGNRLQEWKNANSEMNYAAFHPDSRYLASASNDHKVRIWDTENGKEVKTLEGHSAAVWTLTYSPDGKYLASAGIDTTILVRDANTFEILKTLKGHSKAIRSIQWHPNSSQLLSTGEDQTIRLWDVKLGSEVKQFKGHTGSVYCARFHPNGKWFASGSEDKTIKFWNPTTGTEIKTLAPKHGTIYELCFTPNGKKLICGTSDGSVLIFTAVE